VQQPQHDDAGSATSSITSVFTKFEENTEDWDQMSSTSGLGLHASSRNLNLNLNIDAMATRGGDTEGGAGARPAAPAAATAAQQLDSYLDNLSVAPSSAGSSQQAGTVAPSMPDTAFGGRDDVTVASSVSSVTSLRVTDRKAQLGHKAPAPDPASNEASQTQQEGPGKMSHISAFSAPPPPSASELSAMMASSARPSAEKVMQPSSDAADAVCPPGNLPMPLTVGGAGAPPQGRGSAIQSTALVETTAPDHVSTMQEDPVPGGSTRAGAEAEAAATDQLDAYLENLSLAPSRPEIAAQSAPTVPPTETASFVFVGEGPGSVASR